MPKRESEPKIEEDSTFLVINYPYPLHVNLAIEVDRLEMARWIASCIGSEFLLAFYHRPKAPNVVIIEVAKSCPKINAFLGAHKWREFLRYPEPDEVDMESRVFYCNRKGGNGVKGDGWKRIDVYSAWFENFVPSKRFICDPYPRSSFCEIPPVTQADYAYCHHLPKDVFSRPKPSTKLNIVPGSDEYFAQKTSDGAGSISEPTKPSASVVSPTSTCKTSVEWPSTSSRTSEDSDYEASRSVDITGDANQFFPPPGLIHPKAQSTFDRGYEPASETASSSDSSDWPSSAEIITNGLAATALADSKEDILPAEDDGQYWTGEIVRAIDWDKPICPLHNVHCKAGICQVMAKIEREKKREAEKQNGGGNHEDGWIQTKAHGKYRGRGQGRGWSNRGNGNKNYGGGGRGRGRGGWC